MTWWIERLPPFEDAAVLQPLVGRVAYSRLALFWWRGRLGWPGPLEGAEMLQANHLLVASATALDVAVGSRVVNAVVVDYQHLKAWVVATMKAAAARRGPRSRLGCCYMQLQLLK